MKTIQVSDEVYAFLKSCQEELKNQDNRITANPMFGFKEVVKTASYDPQEYVFVNEDHTESITNTEQETWCADLANYIISRFDESQDLFEILFDHCNLLSEDTDISEDNTEEDNMEILKKEIVIYLNNCSWSLIELLVNEFDISMFGYEKQYRMYEHSISFFESDMQAHLDLNKHNMNEHITFVFSNQRTPKMLQLQDILMNAIKFEEN